jgi:peroxiredoxin
MAQFESRKAEIEVAGAQLVFIAAEKRDGVWKPAKFLEKHPISAPFLLDEDRDVTRKYGIHHALATDALNIAHPSTFLIDQAGTVRYIYRGENQQDRAPLDKVLRAAQQIRSNNVRS